MKKKMPPGGPTWDNTLRAGHQKQSGRLMRRYISSQVFLPPVDENAAWEANEEDE